MNSPQPRIAPSDFWNSAKQRVATSLVIMQQGVELIIKGKIAEISPYILISNTPSKWPKPEENSNLFSDFRMIDAQDLIKAYNLFSPEKFDKKFIEKFNELRNIRNKIMHTVDNNLKINSIEVILNILEIYRYLIPYRNFIE